MAEKQNDQRNQQPDSKSHQEQTQDGKKKEETNPNNPKASQSNEQGSPQGNLKHKDSGSTQGKMNTDVMDTEEQEEEEEEESTSRKAGTTISQKGDK